MKGQIAIQEFLRNRNRITFGCECICKNCLYWWSSRCPHGECYDDHRAIVDPYDKAHPDEAPRKQWSNWNKPGEQAHWCRGGVFYPVHYCEHFMKYKGQEIESCVDASVQIFQDGYIKCNLKDAIGCEECIALKEGKERVHQYDCVWMTETGCEAHINALTLMAHAILKEGLKQEMCKEQCCIGCNKTCGFRCGQGR